MRVLLPSKSAYAVALCAMPLVLTACGSDSADSEATTTVTATSLRPSSSAPSTTETTTSEPTEESTEPAPDNPGDNPPQAQEPAPAPMAPGIDSPANITPIDAGAADQATVDEITALVGGFYQQQSGRSVLLYIPERTCQRALDKQGINLDQLRTMPEISLEQAGVAGWNESSLASVTDVRRDGDSASATITVNTPQGPDSGTMRFAHEHGSWKFCD